MSIERNYSPEEKRLLYLFRTVKKIAKVRRLYINPNGTPRFEEIEREGYTIDFPVCPEEFAFVSHMKDAAEGKPLKPLGQVYFNFRNPPKYMQYLMGQVLSPIIRLVQPDYLAGIPTLGKTLAKECEKQTGVPSVDLFQKVQLKGMTTITEMPEAPRGNGASLLIEDDVLNYGTNSRPAVEAARRLGYKVLGLAVLADRQQGGTKLLSKLGYDVWSLFTGKELLDYYVRQTDETRITEKQYEKGMESLAA